MRSVTWLLILPALWCAVSGCGGADRGLSKQQAEASDRLGVIAKKTGGDWNKLAANDRTFLLGLSQGNEQSARMLLLSAAGKIGGPRRPAAGGPPGRQNR